MQNQALSWISEAYIGGYLRAAFIDCQKAEYLCLDDKTPFTTARNFAYSLRERKISISHFLFDQSKPKSLQPFLYKGAQHHRFPNRNMDFEGVIPDPETEWVYPKETYNGFTNPYSGEILGNSDGNPLPETQSVLICAGFTARACVQETALGSFEKAANPEQHHVIIALNATNLHSDFYGTYINDFLSAAPKHLRHRIGFAETQEIVEVMHTSASP